VVDRRDFGGRRLMTAIGVWDYLTRLSSLSPPHPPSPPSTDYLTGHGVARRLLNWRTVGRIVRGEIAVPVDRENVIIINGVPSTPRVPCG